tara:strand:- start:839 stop:1063 length:225 start_codon:yes stop_codon:yes gene_type:complete
MTTEENLTLQELVYSIQDAADELSKKMDTTFQELVNEYVDTDAFLAGHILGMRDCLTIVAMLYGIEMKGDGEEE